MSAILEESVVTQELSDNYGFYNSASLDACYDGFEREPELALQQYESHALSMLKSDVVSVCCRMMWTPFWRSQW